MKKCPIVLPNFFFGLYISPFFQLQKHYNFTHILTVFIFVQTLTGYHAEIYQNEANRSIIQNLQMLTLRGHTCS